MRKAATVTVPLKVKEKGNFPAERAYNGNFSQDTTLHDGWVGLNYTLWIPDLRIRQVKDSFPSCLHGVPPAQDLNNYLHAR